MLRGRVCVGLALNAARIYICKPSSASPPRAGRIAALNNATTQCEMRGACAAAAESQYLALDVKGPNLRSAQRSPQLAPRPSRPPAPLLSLAAAVRGVGTGSSQTTVSRFAEEGVTRGAGSSKGCKSLSCGCY